MEEANRINAALVPKTDFAIAASGLATMQNYAPAVIAVSSLYGLLGVFEVRPGNYFHSMALVVAFLSIMLLRIPRTATSQLFGGNFTLVIAVGVRWLVVLAVLFTLGYVTRFSTHYPRRVILTWAVLTPALIIGATLVLQELLRRMLCDPANARKAVIAGCTDSSLALARRLRGQNEFRISIAGFFDDRGRDRLRVNGEVSLLGSLTEMPDFVRRNGVEVAFVALPIRPVSRVMELVDELRDSTASIYYLPDIHVFDLIQSRGEVLDGIPVISMCETPFHGQRATAKRLTDLLLTIPLLVLITPLMLAIALAVRLGSPGPVVFRQRRYGLNGEEIVVYKFRTMKVVEDGAVTEQARRGDARFTRVGRFLRRYSLDELPQLINVLQGRMSLVGPRPHTVAHNELYRKLIKGYMLRHKVLPGITGLAQVNGLRGETRELEQMEARVRYDLEYLRCWSVELDLEILARTAVRVLNDSKAF
ncbi:MAG: undecaprenyl-phosphate glucose phosphotransferase [Steroidobacteraceae bacterium]